MILFDEETSAVNVRSTHAVDIFAFVEADEIPFCYFQTPYYLAPAPGDERVYALLRETLNRTGKVGIAYVVIQARKQLAALTPCGPALVLNTLRCDGDETRLDALGLPGEDLTAASLTEHELARATQLVESMTKKWDSGTFRLAEAPEDEPSGDADAADAFRFENNRPEDGSRTMHHAPRNHRLRSRSRRTLH